MTEFGEICLMRRTVWIIAVVGALLAGCGGQGEGTPGGTSAPTTGGTLADLTGDKLCAMVNRATIEQQFHQSVRDAQGGRETHEKRESINCSYVTESLMDSNASTIAKALSISTTVRVASESASTAKKALDGYFVDQGAKTVAYTPLEGLGEAAGYADSKLKVRLGGNHLVAILPVKGKFVEVITKSEPDGTLDQLKPIAQELVKGAESALR
jgi:hypothetical protein